MPVPGVDGLRQVGAAGGLESTEGLAFLRDLHDAVREDLRRVLARRASDRAFIDERTRACAGLNRTFGAGVGDAGHQTVIGMRDGDGRVVVGPLRHDYAEASAASDIAPVPAFLRGHHVTLFGPPDDPKLSINAMNAFHRRMEGEPPIVDQLLRDSDAVAFWGADDEDSKTPLREDLVRAGEHLAGCFRGDLAHTDHATGRRYSIVADRRTRPIKRFPGLALPCTFLFRDLEPVPLHLYDLALHLFANWSNPEALAFYVPKLENEEEAAYLAGVLGHAERLLEARRPGYRPGGIRVLVVLENPRAVFRLNEIVDALHPYFAGASLGWHDFLAGTARLMKEDPEYRIPVKADPEIVIKHIKASHELLARVVKPRGGIAIGGMYGVLPGEGRIGSPSFEVAIRGFLRDVVTQLKRGLDGFWVAHPDFVRIGMALVEAWGRFKTGDRAPIEAMVEGLLSKEHRQEMLAFIAGPDIEGLDRGDPRYPRSLLAADRPVSDVVANHDLEEVRYNCFQCLQYLADWLCGNGCVALPAAIDGVPVRVMDDLATTERSRWEVWHEIRHGRVAVRDLVRIAHEEMRFIREDRAEPGKLVQVKWDRRTRKWYPIALHLMLQLMTAEEPVEFASQLLLPFTIESIRAADDPFEAARSVEPTRYRLEPEVARCHALFAACGARAFVEALADPPVLDLAVVERVVMSFSIDDVVEAAGFHGDIGQRPATLDEHAAREQAAVAGEAEAMQGRLRDLGSRYRERFGFKFLIAARGRSAEELLATLGQRLEATPEEELRRAREALWTIARQRLVEHGADGVIDRIETSCRRHGLRALSLAVCSPRGGPQAIVFGERAPGLPVTADTAFEIASLSKVIGSCFAMEHFRATGVGLDAPLTRLLVECGSQFRPTSHDPSHPDWPDRVQVAHLLRHEAFDRHYVRGVPATRAMPAIEEFLAGGATGEATPVGVAHEPGSRFAYSGGGFLVLEHLLARRFGSPIHQAVGPFLEALGMTRTSLEQVADPLPEVVNCFRDDGTEVEGGRLLFPALAAGVVATPTDVARFLVALARAHRDVDGCGPISHDTAVRMLHGVDRGSRDFMGCDMGLGVFTIEAGPNRFAVHQGANDGARALMAHCFAGPDAGCGVVIAATGEECAVAAIAEIAQTVLGHLGVGGIDWSRRGEPTDAGEAAPEQRVNLGYRDRLFHAFEPDLPESIATRGPLDPLARFNLAVGAVVERVSNQRFARAENLISPHEPSYDPALFGRQGKIMDSWESARHNPHGRDTLILRLAEPSRIDLVVVSTRFHKGNEAESFELEGLDESVGRWVSLVEPAPLAGHTQHVFESRDPGATISKLRVSMRPDGGLTRLGLFGVDLPEADRDRLRAAPRTSFPGFDIHTRRPLTPVYEGPIREATPGCDLASAAHGARLVSAGDEHYGPAVQLISPFPPLDMFDGLESARSREAGHREQVEIELARPARIGRIRIDFTHFVNNNPRAMQVEGRAGRRWTTLVPRTDVKAYAGNVFECRVLERSVCDRIRIVVVPDGGMNRVHVFEANV